MEVDKQVPYSLFSPLPPVKNLVFMSLYFLRLRQQRLDLRVVAERRHAAVHGETAARRIMASGPQGWLATAFAHSGWQRRRPCSPINRFAAMAAEPASPLWA